MKRFFRTLVIFVILLGMVSCNNNDDVILSTSEEVYYATLTGQNQVPANNSKALGRAILKYNNDTKSFVVTIYYTDINLTGASIHRLSDGLTGSLLYDLSIDAIPIVFSRTDLSSFEEVDLKREQFCIVMTSVEYPNGEIWGRFTRKVSGSGSGGDGSGGIAGGGNE
ncbi:MAG: CHRD domain-containing protein [Flavobacterium sp.]